MKIERNVPGHFCSADKCEYFRHTDIATSNLEEDTVFCISSIGAMPAEEQCYLSSCILKNGKLYEKINIDTIYEIMVFDKTSEHPFTEIEAFRSNDLSEIKRKHDELVLKYTKILSCLSKRNR